MLTAMDHLREHFPGAAGYLNTSSIGLPPDHAIADLQQAIENWQNGRATAPDYDRYIAESRQLFASMLSVPPEWVAIGSQVSALVGLLATSLEPGSRVLCAEGEFTSVTFPFLVRDDLEVTFLPLDELASGIDREIDLVAFSVVQSADGRVADCDAISAAARNSGALTLVDATQAAGWLPLQAAQFDVVVVGAYKWLLSPRGTAFMTVRPELLPQIRPVYAGWYAGAEPWETIYDPPLRLADNARRLDLSPAWLSWLGTASALRFLEPIGVAAIHEHNVGLANDFRTAVGLPAGNSAIVALRLDSTFDGSRLTGLSTAIRAGALRVAFHLYNNSDDVDQLTTAVQGFVADRPLL